MFGYGLLWSFLSYGLVSATAETYKNGFRRLLAVVKIDCSKRLAFLLYDFKLISNQQQLISKTDTYV